MALLRDLERIQLQSEKIHLPARSSYTSFIGNDGKRYFQIDSYGSDNRELKGKKSQSMQFDEETARALIDIIRTELNL